MHGHAEYHYRCLRLPTVVPALTTGDDLPERAIIVMPKEWLVALEDIKRQSRHLLDRYAAIDMGVAQRAIEAGDMVVELKGLCP